MTLFTLLALIFMPHEPQVGPTWTWPDHTRVGDIGAPTWGR